MTRSYSMLLLLDMCGRRLLPSPAAQGRYAIDRSERHASPDAGPVIVDDPFSFGQTEVDQERARLSVFALEELDRLRARHELVRPEIRFELLPPFLGIAKAPERVLPVRDLTRRHSARPYHEPPIRHDCVIALL